MEFYVNLTRIKIVELKVGQSWILPSYAVLIRSIYLFLIHTVYLRAKGGLMVLGLENFLPRREISLTVEDLRHFENSVANEYECGNVKGPIHLSEGNEVSLIEIFEKISTTDLVFSAWRNHYHALLHGIDPEFLFAEICAGRSMGIMSDKPFFFSSSIVGGILPIALGSALQLQRTTSNNRVWCFVGDMTYESGLFHEAQKYARNHGLPISFVVEDNGKSVTTETRSAWGEKQSIADGVISYSFSSKFPHHGTGRWVNF